MLDYDAIAESDYLTTPPAPPAWHVPSAPVTPPAPPTPPKPAEIQPSMRQQIHDPEGWKYAVDASIREIHADDTPLPINKLALNLAKHLHATDLARSAVGATNLEDYLRRPARIWFGKLDKSLIVEDDIDVLDVETELETVWGKTKMPKELCRIPFVETKVRERIAARDYPPYAADFPEGKWQNAIILLEELQKNEGRDARGNPFPFPLTNRALSEFFGQSNHTFGGRMLKHYVKQGIIEIAKHGNGYVRAKEKTKKKAAQSEQRPRATQYRMPLAYTT